MTACEIVFYGCFFIILAGHVLSDSNALNVLKTLLTFTQAFVLEYGFRLAKGKMKDDEAAHKAFYLLSEAILAIFKQHFCLQNIMSRCSAALKRIQDGAADVLGVSSFDGRTLPTLISRIFS